MRLLLLSIFIFTACSTRIDSSPKSDEKMVFIKQTSVYKNPWSKEGMNVPNWVMNPTMDGKYEGACGSCPIGKLSFFEYKDIAYQNAVAEIARSRKVRVKNVTKDYESTTNSYFESTSKLESNEHIENATIISSWVQQNTQEYYIWVVVFKGK